MKIFVRGDRTAAVTVESGYAVEALRSAVEAATGIAADEQCLSYAGKPLRDGNSLNTFGIKENSTLDLSLRLLGGAKNLQLTIKPRVQKDKWSLYWKARSCTLEQVLESMETKTEMLEDIKLALPATTRVAEMQKEIEKKMGWEPTSKLKRLEGFKDPWETTVFKGRLMLPDETLEECGVPSGAQLISVRRVLVPDGWKMIKEGEEDDYISSDEDW
ncbi:probable ubiquitin-60S ribosomal protein L40 at N-terminal half [Coccomyxa sp. Obi]|nr:probable ubiquitin-60S ribosomal protein L40 at N-terminal half [Coccomyxa sp. Obi]